MWTPGKRKFDQRYYVLIPSLDPLVILVSTFNKKEEKRRKRKFDQRYYVLIPSLDPHVM
jgi:hypothetical protein